MASASTTTAVLVTGVTDTRGKTGARTTAVEKAATRDDAEATAVEDAARLDARLEDATDARSPTSVAEEATAEHEDVDAPTPVDAEDTNAVETAATITDVAADAATVTNAPGSTSAASASPARTATLATTATSEAAVAPLASPDRAESTATAHEEPTSNTLGGIRATIASI